MKDFIKNFQLYAKTMKEIEEETYEDGDNIICPDCKKVCCMCYEEHLELSL